MAEEKENKNQKITIMLVGGIAVILAAVVLLIIFPIFKSGGKEISGSSASNKDYYVLAFNSRNISYCQKISDKSDSANCVVNIALLLGESAHCNTLKSSVKLPYPESNTPYTADVPSNDLCWFAFTRTKLGNFCSIISDSKLKEDCNKLPK